MSDGPGLHPGIAVYFGSQLRASHAGLPQFKYVGVVQYEDDVETKPESKPGDKKPEESGGAKGPVTN